MVQLLVTQAEHQLLADILQQQIYDLRTEILDTDKRDYKKMLKDQKSSLVQLLEKIQTMNQDAKAV